MSILSNFDLQKILNKLNIKNVKIISKDEKYDNPYNKYIINLHDYNKPGSHWVSLIDNFYFDSYGLIAPNEIEHHLNNEYYYNDHQYQHLKATNCGWYALYFHLYFNNKKINKDNFKIFLNQFNIINNNDELIINNILNNINR